MNCDIFLGHHVAAQDRDIREGSIKPDLEIYFRNSWQNKTSRDERVNVTRDEQKIFATQAHNSENVFCFVPVFFFPNSTGGLPWQRGRQLQDGCWWSGHDEFKHTLEQC